MTSEIKKIIREHYRKLGKKGGASTVEKYGKLKMAEWGSLGGRPKGSKNKKIGGTITEQAKKMGISRQTFYTRLKKGVIKPENLIKTT